MLIFKPHSIGDIPLRVKWLNNKKANIFAIDDPDAETTFEKEKKWFESYQKNKSKKFFTIFFDDSPIGFMGLTINKSNNKEAGLFIMIGEDSFRGKGYGKESLKYLINYAFKTLKLDRLIAEVNKKNIASIKLNKSLNFATTGEDGKEIKFALNKGQGID